MGIRQSFSLHSITDSCICNGWIPFSPTLWHWCLKEQDTCCVWCSSVPPQDHVYSSKFPSYAYHPICCSRIVFQEGEGKTLQVINAVQDLADGKLSRIWNRDPLLQLSSALHESIFKLPPSKLQRHYLENAKQCLESLVDRGMQCMSTMQRMSTSMHGLQLLLSTLVLNMLWIQLTTGAKLQSGTLQSGMHAGRKIRQFFHSVASIVFHC
jgi:hypothetical protein